ncbi:MAG: SDR family NAD(P)-dependent oxidoreductase [Myxococcota bacterium]
MRQARWDRWLDTVVVLSYTSIGYRIRERLLWKAGGLDLSMEGKICAVTGANAGLGRAVCEALAQRGAKVVMLCRNLERGERARDAVRRKTGNPQVVLEQVDVSQMASIRACAARLEGSLPRLDVLINNASVMVHERQTTDEGLELTFATNTLGTFMMTRALLPMLRISAPSRVITVSSGGMYLVRLRMDDIQYLRRPYDGVRAYAESKRAQIMLMEWMAKRERGDIRFDAVHPGWATTPGVRSSLPIFHRFMQPWLRTPEQGADSLIWLAISPDVDDVERGAFWFDRRPRPTDHFAWTRATAEERQALWKMCCDIADEPVELSPTQAQTPGSHEGSGR